MRYSAAVRRAQRRIVPLMRARPSDVRAGLPFDPEDPEDVCFWIRGQIRRSRRPEGIRTNITHAVRRLVWDARNTGRRRSRCARSQRERGRRLRKATFVYNKRLTCGGLNGLPDRSGVEELMEDEAAENLLVCATSAANAMCRRNGRTRRIGRSALSCLMRIVYAAKSTLSPSVGVRFASELVLHPVFNQLPINAETKRHFFEASRRLTVVVNLRHDIAKAGWSCPGNAQWKEFLAEFESERQRQFL
jgi:hypothetical protein